MLQGLFNIFKVAEIRKKVLFTLSLIVVYRIGAYIPTPGINTANLARFFDRIAGTQGGALFGIMNMFSGGAMRRLTIFALGIMPYITASIILQLLVAVFPNLEKLTKDPEGHKRLVQYTRQGTVVLCLIQGLFGSIWLENPMHFGGLEIVQFPGWRFRLLTMLTLTTGTTFIMWLGEQITERGIGNGISLIITAGIISRLPTAVYQIFSLLYQKQMGLLTLLLMSAIAVVVVGAVVLITEGQRKIPVQYARRIIGRRVYGGQATYIPLRVNQGGVMPIIFAQAILFFPGVLAGWTNSRWVQSIANVLTPGRLFYSFLYSLLIIFFAYFYTAISFNPKEIADNMKKYGGFVPGIRPGKNTAEYFDYIMNRIILPGAIFLAIIAIMPHIIYKGFKLPYLVASFFGGTGLLIIVGVLLDTMRQLESQLLMRHYEGFVSKGRIRGR
ncbi:MAG: preprotein translocase subunit SecY [Candidatus Omnitrophota bacterium]|nr:MAG: preprotein translocase subunit SecY [Candidatus Omnitrophota bacterium]